MCPQTVGLVQKVCEEVGISTTSISIIDEINQKIHALRFYSVPFELGFPLGNPKDFENQIKICRNTIQLLT